MRPVITSIEDWRNAGTYFDFRGRRVFYRDEGKGPALLCIHGYPTASYDYHKIWPALTERFRVIAPDMLGFGYTDKPRGHRYSIFEQADLHIALLEHLGIGSIDVLCHDYGVTVGQELLARQAEGRPPQLRSIAFLNGGLFPETHRARPVQRLLASPIGPLLSQLSGESQFRKALANVFGPRTQPTNEEHKAFYALMERDNGKRALAGLIAYMAERRANRPRWVGAFVESRVPMLVINGVLDPVSGAHMLDRLVELRPRTEIVRLDVGHYPQVEAPEAVLSAWLPFVAARQTSDLPSV